MSSRERAQALIAQWKADSTLLPEPKQHDWYAVRESELTNVLTAALAAPALGWTKERPDKPGWYWYREATWKCINSVSEGFFVYPDGRHVDEMNGEWAGPIPIPLEVPT